MILRLPTFIIVLGVLLSQQAWSQSRYTLSGYIKDASNGEVLVGATVYIKEIGKGATSNVYGFYSITVPAASYTVEYTFVGYQKIEKQIALMTSRPPKYKQSR